MNQGLYRSEYCESITRCSISDPWKYHVLLVFGPVIIPQHWALVLCTDNIIRIATHRASDSCVHATETGHLVFSVQLTAVDPT